MAATVLSQSSQAEATQGQQHEVRLKPRGKLVDNPSCAYVFVLDYYLLAEAQQQEEHPSASEWPRASNSIEYDVKYSPVPAKPKIQELLNPDGSLGKYAEALREELLHHITKNWKIPIILVGWGYGGLICEQTALAVSEDKSLGIYICGTVLVGTPHYHKGLAQWAMLCTNKGKEKKGNTPDDRRKSDTSTAVHVLSEKQETFRKTFLERDEKFMVACCFAGQPESRSNAGQGVSSDWCVLSGSWVAEIDATYSQMTAFNGGVDVQFTEIAKVAETWYTKRGAASLKPDFNKRTVYDMKVTKSPFLSIQWQSPGRVTSDNVRLGDVVTSIRDMEVLATADEIKGRLATTDPAETAPKGRSADDMETNQEQAYSKGIATLEPSDAKEYAKGAVRLDKVKKQLRSCQVAYLVVATNPAPGAKDQATDTPNPQVKEVQLLPIRVPSPSSPMPQSRTTRSHSRAGSMTQGVFRA